MRKSRPLYLILSGAVLIVVLTLTTLPRPADVYAATAAETVTSQPGETVTPVTPGATVTPVTPGATVTPVTPGATVTPVTQEPPETVEPGETPTTVPPAPVSIPEPITVVLFGTGLAALSAAAASRRKNEVNNNESSKSDE